MAIVEDEPKLSVIYERVLKRDGFSDLLIASSGDEIVKLAGNSSLKIDIVIIDYRMPGKLNGLEAAKELVRLNSNTSVIIATSDANAESEAKSLGFDFIRKPFSIIRLIELVNSKT